ncbi:MAG: DUF3015 domain-containing protein [Epsilonproteobacteria bacterium]|nr:DUF3015 domain-containing protein [Campylobacterota bacterium]
MKKLLISLAAVATFSSGLFATVNSQTGCGLGAMLVKDDSTAFMLALQATTNATSFNQTFGITSGTSGCKRARLVLNERAEEFVAANMDTLAKEISMGQGESIDTLAELLNIEDKEAFASTLQKNYNKIYSHKDVEMHEVLDSVAQTAL